MYLILRRFLTMLPEVGPHRHDRRCGPLAELPYWQTTSCTSQKPVVWHQRLRACCAAQLAAAAVTAAAPPAAPAAADAAPTAADAAPEAAPAAPEAAPAAPAPTAEPAPLIAEPAALAPAPTAAPVPSMILPVPSRTVFHAVLAPLPMALLVPDAASLQGTQIERVPPATRAATPDIHVPVLLHQAWAASAVDSSSALACSSAR